MRVKNAVTLYSRYTFTRILQTAHFDCCTVWLLVGQHVGWQTVGRQAVANVVAMSTVRPRRHVPAVARQL